MDRSTIGVRFSVIPLRHWVAAAALAAALPTAGLVITLFASRQFESSAVLSVDRTALGKAAGGGAPLSAAGMVSAALRDGGARVEGENGRALSGAEIAGARLTVAEMPGAKIRVELTGGDRAHTRAAAQVVTLLLTEWNPAGGQGDTRLVNAGSSSAAATAGDDRKGDSSRKGYSSEVRLLRTTLSMLDLRVKGLETKLGAAAGKSAGREQVQGQLTNLRKQRSLLDARLEEAQREANSPGEAVAPAAPAARMAATGIDAGEDEAARGPFVVLEPATEARVVEDWRAKAGTLGMSLGLAGALLYLVVVLWRFRPVRGAMMLRELLPHDVIFVGGILEDRK